MEFVLRQGMEVCPAAMKQSGKPFKPESSPACVREQTYETKAGVSICGQLVILQVDLVLLSARYRALVCKRKHIYENIL